MRLSVASLSLLALVGSSSAQYFSAGWTPGQPGKPTGQQATATYDPSAAPTGAPAGSQNAAPFRLSDLLNLDKVLTSEPAVALFHKLGINITERVQAAVNQEIWDKRVQLITDDNYDDLIVNESLTEEEEKQRVWLIVISATSAKQDGISKYMDNVFDSAFNQTQLAGDLPNVKWGRIDYLNVTAITTRWGVWKAPYLVVLTDRGQTLRFYGPYQLRLRDDAIREFLRIEGWRQSKPWSTSFSPGGRNEYIMIFFAVWLTKIYNYTVLIPKWLLLMISGGLGSLIINLMHKPSLKKAEEARVKAAARAKATEASEAKPAAVVAPTPAAAASAGKGKAKAVAHTDSEAESSAPAKRTSARQRKNKK